MGHPLSVFKSILLIYLENVEKKELKCRHSDQFMGQLFDSVNM